MELLRLLFVILFTSFLGYSLLKSGIEGIKKKYTPFGLYDPRWNIILGLVGIISGLIFFVKLVKIILF